MDEIEDKYRFRFNVDPTGKLAKYPRFPWSVGSPGNKISIQLFNQHAGVPHRVRLISWIHKESGKLLDPLTGTLVWQSSGPGTTTASVHEVRNHPGTYDAYRCRTELDDHEDHDGEGAEIIIDPPPEERQKAKGRRPKAEEKGARPVKADGAARRQARKAGRRGVKRAKPRKAGKTARKSGVQRPKKKGSRKRGARTRRRS